ncbi:hypothetical protein Q3V37_14575 [Micromonospora profundi]|uniref:Uncharacterized protein n=1 Tax=Micromonospora profundi TaxID=1420889 RepID=A0AAJ6L4P4_9ACTN|nr:hypothetical protein [Micromonospora profundi]NJC10836.1 hypothetical protein [Micromonospora profundi]WLS48345.1 hypothetical protein Q3V37_14575 [Micromonospora profundi]
MPTWMRWPAMTRGSSVADAAFDPYRFRVRGGWWPGGLAVVGEELA